jgi:hypothetical protein
LRGRSPYLLAKCHTAFRCTTACGVPLGRQADVVYSGTHRCAICQRLRGWIGKRATEPWAYALILARTLRVHRAEGGVWPVSPLRWGPKAATPRRTPYSSLFSGWRTRRRGLLRSEEDCGVR